MVSRSSVLASAQQHSAAAAAAAAAYYGYYPCSSYAVGTNAGPWPMSATVPWPAHQLASGTPAAAVSATSSNLMPTQSTATFHLPGGGIVQQTGLPTTVPPPPVRSINRRAQMRTQATQTEPHHHHRHHPHHHYAIYAEPRSASRTPDRDSDIYGSRSVSRTSRHLQSGSSFESYDGRTWQNELPAYLTLSPRSRERCRARRRLGRSRSVNAHEPSVSHHPYLGHHPQQQQQQQQPPPSFYASRVLPTAHHVTKPAEPLAIDSWDDESKMLRRREQEDEEDEELQTAELLQMEHQLSVRLAKLSRLNQLEAFEYANGRPSSAAARAYLRSVRKSVGEIEHLLRGRLVADAVPDAARAAATTTADADYDVDRSEPILRTRSKTQTFSREMKHQGRLRPAKSKSIDGLVLAGREQKPTMTGGTICSTKQPVIGSFDADPNTIPAEGEDLAQLVQRLSPPPAFQDEPSSSAILSGPSDLNAALESALGDALEEAFEKVADVMRGIDDSFETTIKTSDVALMGGSAEPLLKRSTDTSVAHLGPGAASSGSSVYLSALTSCSDRQSHDSFWTARCSFEPPLPPLTAAKTPVGGDDSLEPLEKLQDKGDVGLLPLGTVVAEEILRPLVEGGSLSEESDGSAKRGEGKLRSVDNDEEQRRLSFILAQPSTEGTTDRSDAQTVVELESDPLLVQQTDASFRMQRQVEVIMEQTLKPEVAQAVFVEMSFAEEAEDKEVKSFEEFLERQASFEERISSPETKEQVQQIESIHEMESSDSSQKVEQADLVQLSLGAGGERALIAPRRTIKLSLEAIACQQITSTDTLSADAAICPVTNLEQAKQKTAAVATSLAEEEDEDDRTEQQSDQDALDEGEPVGSDDLEVFAEQAGQAQTAPGPAEDPELAGDPALVHVGGGVYLRRGVSSELSTVSEVSEELSNLPGSQEASVGTSSGSPAAKQLAQLEAKLLHARDSSTSKSKSSTQTSDSERVSSSAQAISLESDGSEFEHLHVVESSSKSSSSNSTDSGSSSGASAMAQLLEAAAAAAEQTFAAALATLNVAIDHRPIQLKLKQLVVENEGDQPSATAEAEAVAASSQSTSSTSFGLERLSESELDQPAEADTKPTGVLGTAAAGTTNAQLLQAPIAKPPRGEPKDTTILTRMQMPTVSEGLSSIHSGARGDVSANEVPTGVETTSGAEYQVSQEQQSFSWPVLRAKDRSTQLRTTRSDSMLQELFGSPGDNRRLSCERVLSGDKGVRSSGERLDSSRRSPPGYIFSALETSETSQKVRSPDFKPEVQLLQAGESFGEPALESQPVEKESLQQRRLERRAAGPPVRERPSAPPSIEPMPLDLLDLNNNHSERFDLNRREAAAAIAEAAEAEQQAVERPVDTGESSQATERDVALFSLEQQNSQDLLDEDSLSFCFTQSGTQPFSLEQLESLEPLAPRPPQLPLPILPTILPTSLTNTQQSPSPSCPPVPPTLPTKPGTVQTKKAQFERQLSGPALSAPSSTNVADGEQLPVRRESGQLSGPASIAPMAKTSPGVTSVSAASDAQPVIRRSSSRIQMLLQQFEGGTSAASGSLQAQAGSYRRSWRRSGSETGPSVSQPDPVVGVGGKRTQVRSLDGSFDPEAALLEAALEFGPVFTGKKLGGKRPSRDSQPDGHVQSANREDEEDELPLSEISLQGTLESLETGEALQSSQAVDAVPLLTESSPMSTKETSCLIGSPAIKTESSTANVVAAGLSSSELPTVSTDSSACGYQPMPSSAATEERSGWSVEDSRDAIEESKQSEQRRKSSLVALKREASHETAESDSREKSAGEEYTESSTAESEGSGHVASDERMSADQHTETLTSRTASMDRATSTSSSSCTAERAEDLANISGLDMAKRRLLAQATIPLFPVASSQPKPGLVETRSVGFAYGEDLGEQI